MIFHFVCRSAVSYVSFIHRFFLLSSSFCVYFNCYSLILFNARTCFDNNYCISEINVGGDSSLGIGIYFPFYLFVC